MDAGSELRQRGVVAALGVTQILAWGCSYYLPAVLAQPITMATGWPLPWITGGLSLGLLVAGRCSPMVGRAIERTGGRPVLASSSALLGAGLMALGLAPNLPAYLAAWLVIGVCMGAGLYDAAFATLGRLYGARAGIFSIARGTLPLALFGASGYAALMGRLAMPMLIAGALAPSAGALLLARAGADTTLAALTGLAAANIALMVGLRLRLAARE